MNNLSDKKLYDTLIEQSLLGAVLIDKNVFTEIENLQDDIFKHEQHKIIFQSMRDVHKKNNTVDLILLTEHMKVKNILDDVGGISYLTSLSTIVITTSNIDKYIKILKELEFKRKVIQASYNLINDISTGEDVNTSLNKFETTTALKEEVLTNNTLREILYTVYDDLENVRLIDKLKIGISIIDECTNGIAKGELVTIGAHSGVGKSALAINIAINSYKQHKKILIISREMTKEQIAERIILSHTGFSKKKYEDRSFDENDWMKIIKTMEIFSTDNIKIDDKTSTIQGIKQELRKFKPDILIVDYIQLLTPNSLQNNREREVAELSRELKKITLDYGIIVFQLTQLAEKGIGNYRPHGESYTRESRSIYHDSNIVIYIHEVTEEKEIEVAYKKTVFEEKGDIDNMKSTLNKFRDKGIKFIELIVDKNRSGEVGSNYYWFKGSDLTYYPIT